MVVTLVSALLAANPHGDAGEREGNYDEDESSDDQAHLIHPSKWPVEVDVPPAIRLRPNGTGLGA